MKKHYKFNYDWHQATCELIIDQSILTKESAKELLEFFSWDWDEDNDVYEELAKKYAMKAIKFATFNNHNLIGVLDDFKETEGFPELNGKYGIELVAVELFEFVDDELELDSAKII